MNMLSHRRIELVNMLSHKMIVKSYKDSVSLAGQRGCIMEKLDCRRSFRSSQSPIYLKNTDTTLSSAILPPFQVNMCVTRKENK